MVLHILYFLTKKIPVPLTGLIDIIFLFSPEKGSDISCKLSPLETICMQCRNLFSEKNKENISICRQLKILPRVLNVRFDLFFKYRDVIKICAQAHPTFCNPSVRKSKTGTGLNFCYAICLFVQYSDVPIGLVHKKASVFSNYQGL